MTLRDLLVISGLCLLTEDADEAFRLTLKKEIIHLYGEDVFERLEAIEASNEESEEVMLQILRSLAVDQEFLDVKAGIPARDAEIAALRKEIETLKATMGAEPVAVPKGWKLVPIEPTDAMLLAGYSDVHDTEIWWSLMLNAAPAAPVATPTPAFSVGVHGVGIIDDNPSALAVYFNAAPNDDDIRALHEIVSGTPVAAQVQADTRTPADMLVNGGALILALNALRRAGKHEIADELEKTATRAQQPVSGADQFRDAAQMIEPSGNSGELPPLPQGISKHGVIGHDSDVYTEAHMLDYSRAALAQQDACTTCSGVGVIGHSVICPECGVAQQDAETEKSALAENQEVADGYGWHDGEDPPNSLLYQCMAPFHLNLCRGQELQSVIDYGRLVWSQARSQQEADKVDAERWRAFLKTANQKGGLIVRWYDHSDLRTRPASRLDIERLIDAAREEKP